MDGLEEFLQTCALVVGQRARLGIAPRRVDAHVVVGSRHRGVFRGWLSCWETSVQGMRAQSNEGRNGERVWSSISVCVAAMEWMLCCRRWKRDGSGKPVGTESCVADGLVCGGSGVENALLFTVPCSVPTLTYCRSLQGRLEVGRVDVGVALDSRDPEVTGSFAGRLAICLED